MISLLFYSLASRNTMHATFATTMRNKVRSRSFTPHHTQKRTSLTVTTPQILRRVPWRFLLNAACVWTILFVVAVSYRCECTRHDCQSTQRNVMCVWQYWHSVVKTKVSDLTSFHPPPFDSEYRVEPVSMATFDKYPAHLSLAYRNYTQMHNAATAEPKNETKFLIVDTRSGLANRMLEISSGKRTNHVTLIK